MVGDDDLQLHEDNSVQVDEDTGLSLEKPVPAEDPSERSSYSVSFPVVYDLGSNERAPVLHRKGVSFVESPGEMVVAEALPIW